MSTIRSVNWSLVNYVARSSPNARQQLNTSIGQFHGGGRQSVTNQLSSLFFTVNWLILEQLIFFVNLLLNYLAWKTECLRVFNLRILLTICNCDSKIYRTANRIEKKSSYRNDEYQYVFEWWLEAVSVWAAVVSAGSSFRCFAAATAWKNRTSGCDWRVAITARIEY